MHRYLSLVMILFLTGCIRVPGPDQLMSNKPGMQMAPTRTVSCDRKPICSEEVFTTEKRYKPRFGNRSKKKDLTSRERAAQKKNQRAAKAENKTPKAKREKRRKLTEAEKYNNTYYGIDGDDVTRVVYHYLPFINHQYHFRLEDSYVTSGDAGYKIRLDFSSMDIKEMAEAREAMVDLVEGLLERLNNDEVLAGKNFGEDFTEFDLEVYITYKSYYVQYVDEQMAAFASLRGGLVHYWAGDANNDDPECWHWNSETYKQSREIVTAYRDGVEYYEENTPPPVKSNRMGHYLLN